MQLSTLNTTGTEPVTLTLAKEYLRVRHSVEDNSITQMIRSARSLLERVGRISILQHSMLAQYRHPFRTHTDFMLNSRVQDPDTILHRVVLPHGPIRAITEITRITQADGTEVLGTNEYTFSEALGEVYFAKAFKLSNEPTARIMIKYTAGFDQSGDTALHPLPEDIRSAVLDTVVSFYETRDMSKLPASALLVAQNYWKPY